MTQDSMNKSAGIGAGFGFAVSLLRELYFQAIDQSFNISDMLLMSLVGAFLGSIIGALIFGLFSITKNSSSQVDHPFLKGIIWVFVPLLVSTGIDAILLRGTYLFIPILSLLSDGSLRGTYYGCEDWIVANEGSYCYDY